MEEEKRMTFEQDLITELSTINGLTSASMLIAKEGSVMPFAVANKEDDGVTFNINLSTGGIMSTKAVYVISVVSQSYAQASSIQDAIKDKLFSLRGLPMGSNGTILKGIDISYLPDMYEYEPERFVSLTKITAIF